MREKEFLKLLKELPEIMEDEKIYLCYTHERIIRDLSSSCEIKIFHQGRKKNLKRISSQLLNERCRHCKDRDKCSVGKDYYTVFYAVSFRKK